MNIAELIAISREPNVAAFLRVIRFGESGQSDTAYRMLYGGTLFDDLAAHPRRAIRSPWGWTSAAGAYQIVALVPGRTKMDTEDWLVRTYGFTDFAPEQQDARAVALIIRRKALPAIRAGKIAEAIHLCRQEWASLPGSEHGQPTRKLDACLAVFRQYGGRIAGETEGAPIEASKPTYEAPPQAPVRDVDTAELVSSVWRALRAGYKLANSATWKNRQLFVNSAAGLIGAAVAIAKALGHELPISDADVAALAGAAGVLVGMFNAWATAATSGTVGLPAGSDRDSGGGA